MSGPSTGSSIAPPSHASERATKREGGSYGSKAHTTLLRALESAALGIWSLGKVVLEVGVVVNNCVAFNDGGCREIQPRTAKIARERDVQYGFKSRVHANSLGVLASKYATVPRRMATKHHGSRIERRGKDLRALRSVVENGISSWASSELLTKWCCSASGIADSSLEVKEA